MKTYAYILLSLVFCIAINAADENKTKTATQKTQKREKGFLGVAVTTFQNKLFRSHMNVPKRVGLVIVSVKNDSAAAKAGLKVNDVILALDKQTIVDPRQFGTLVGIYKPGDKITLTVIHGGVRKRKEITLQKQTYTMQTFRHDTMNDPTVRVYTSNDQFDNLCTAMPIDLKKINDIYKNKKLSDREKNKLINELLSKNMFQNIVINVHDRHIGVKPGRGVKTQNVDEYLKTLPEEMRLFIKDKIERDKKRRKSLKLEMIDSDKGQTILHESTPVEETSKKTTP